MPFGCCNLTREAHLRRKIGPSITTRIRVEELLYSTLLKSSFPVFTKAPSLEQDPLWSEFVAHCRCCSNFTAALLFCSPPQSSNVVNSSAAQPASAVSSPPPPPPSPASKQLPAPCTPLCAHAELGLTSRLSHPSSKRIILIAPSQPLSLI